MDGMSGRKIVIRNNVNGWLALDKPVGMTSNQVLGRLKFLLKPSKVGHAGTLDPMASGMLPVAFGEATKTVSYAMEGSKVYRFTILWGDETATDDVEGEVVASSSLRPEKENILGVIGQFIGEIAQYPPQYSAKKIGGQRAYELARRGERVLLSENRVVVERLKLVAIPNRDCAVFEVKCGKGMYVRSLGRDISRALGTFGHIGELRRLSVGPFDESEMVTLKKIEEIAIDATESVLDEVSKFIRPVETVLDDIPALAVDRADAVRLRNGQAVILRGREIPATNGMVGVLSAGELVVLAEYRQGALHPKRVFNFNQKQPN